MPESVLLSMGMSLTAVLVYDGKEVKDVGESRYFHAGRVLYHDDL